MLDHIFHTWFLLNFWKIGRVLGQESEGACRGQEGEALTFLDPDHN